VLDERAASRGERSVLAPLPDDLSRHARPSSGSAPCRPGLMTLTPAGHRTPHPRLIVGLIPEALGPMADDMRRALDDRRDLIEQRARSLAAEAVATKVSWVRRLGEPPIDRRDRERWDHVIATVAAYRDRCGLTSVRPLGGDVTNDTQRLDRARAGAVIR